MSNKEDCEDWYEMSKQERERDNMELGAEAMRKKKHRMWLRYKAEEEERREREDLRRAIRKEIEEDMEQAIWGDVSKDVLEKDRRSSSDSSDGFQVQRSKKKSATQKPVNRRPNADADKSRRRYSPERSPEHHLSSRENQLYSDFYNQMRQLTANFQIYAEKRKNCQAKMKELAERQKRVENSIMSSSLPNSLKKRLAMIKQEKIEI